MGLKTGMELSEREQLHDIGLSCRCMMDSMV